MRNGRIIQLFFGSTSMVLVFMAACSLDVVYDQGNGGLDGTAAKDSGDADVFYSDADGTVEATRDSVVEAQADVSLDSTAEASIDSSVLLTTQQKIDKFAYDMAVAYCTGAYQGCGQPARWDQNGCATYMKQNGFVNILEGIEANGILAAGNIEFHELEATQCLATIRSLHLKAITQADMQRVLTQCTAPISGTLEAGKSCIADMECASGLICRGTNGVTAGSCTTPGKNGETCTYTGQKALSRTTCSLRGYQPNRLQCDTSYHCGARLQVGQACTQFEQCENEMCGLVAGTTDQYACTSTLDELTTNNVCTYFIR